MLNKYHPSHDIEWRDSSHYEFVCKKCNEADSPSGWGKLSEPCPLSDKVLIGGDPLPDETIRENLWKLIEYIDENYELAPGISTTSLYWQFAHDLSRATRIRNGRKDNGKH